MIEVKMDIVDGAKFYTIKLLEPDRMVNGVPIYYIDEKEIKYFGGNLKQLGLKKGEFNYRRGYEYTLSKYFVWYKIDKVANKFYWTIIKWLYLNACIFRKVPSGQRFSWNYFTLFCWYKSIRALLYCWYKSIRAKVSFRL